MLDEIIKKIESTSELSRDDIIARIENKKTEFGGMISDHGAARVIAKELGIDIQQVTRLKISSLMPGIKNASIVGKITNVYPVNEFNTEKASGKVLNLILSDESGSIRLTLWNDEIEKYDLKQGDVISVKGVTKEGYENTAEIHLGAYGSIEKSEEKIEVQIPSLGGGRSLIRDLKENTYAEIRACIVRIFDGKMFYYRCSKCSKGINKETGKCNDHNDAELTSSIFLRFIIDDGTEVINTVAFNGHAEKIIGITAAEAKNIIDETKDTSEVLNKAQLGKDYILTGRVKRNDFSERIELIVNSIEEVDISKEIRLLNN